MRHALTIAAKDLRLQLGDGTMLLFAVILPLGLAFLFSTLMGDPQQGFRASYVVADEDGGPAAAAFVAGTLAAVGEDSSFDIEPVGSAAEATEQVADGGADAAFIIPAGFSDDVANGDPAALRVVGGADAGITAYVARQIAEGYATQVGGVQLAVAVTLAGTQVDDPAELAARAEQAPLPLAVITDTAADRELDIRTYYSAGMAVFFLFFVAMLSVSGLLSERTEKTMARLLAAPVSRPAILVGKLLGGVGVGLVAMAVLVTASSLLLGAAWGPPLGVAVLVVALVLAASGLMAMVATFTRTIEQASNWMSGLAVLLGMFGGSFVPLAQLGGLATVSYATPHRWFLQGLSDLAGGELAVVVVPVLALLGFAAVTFSVTLLRIRKVVTA